MMWPGFGPHELCICLRGRNVGSFIGHNNDDTSNHHHHHHRRNHHRHRHRHRPSSIITNQFWVKWLVRLSYLYSCVSSPRLYRWCLVASGCRESMEAHCFGSLPCDFSRSTDREIGWKEPIDCQICRTLKHPEMFIWHVHFSQLTWRIQSSRASGISHQTWPLHHCTITTHTLLLRTDERPFLLVKSHLLLVISP